MATPLILKKKKSIGLSKCPYVYVYADLYVCKHILCLPCYSISVCIYMSVSLQYQGHYLHLQVELVERSDSGFLQLVSAISHFGYS